MSCFLANALLILETVCTSAGEWKTDAFIGGSWHAVARDVSRFDGDSPREIHHRIRGKPLRGTRKAV